MTGPIVVFGDAVSVMANYLRTALATRTEDYVQGVIVGTRTPDDRDPQTARTPLVVVSQDGPGSIQSGANARVTLRLAVWHTTDDDAHDLAQIVQGIASTCRGRVIRSALPRLSPARAADPDTGEPMAWCTVTANISPQALT